MLSAPTVFIVYAIIRQFQPQRILALKEKIICIFIDHSKRYSRRQVARIEEVSS
jgi:hypothetical protein